MKERNKSQSVYPQGTLTCSVCGKVFEANSDTRYIINGGYTCSWKCFLTESKKRSSESVIAGGRRNVR